jgi:Flp pilus assembly protein TadG
LQLFSRDKGSAVVEFVMLGTPALLIFATGISLFGNTYQDAMLRSIAIDGSRYAALADQDVAGATKYLNDKLAKLLPATKVSSLIRISKTAVVEITYSPNVNILNFGLQNVKIRVETPVESF